MQSCSPLFFDSHFQANLDWRNTHLRVGSVTPLNKEQISAGLRDMSHESIRNRFLGSKRSFSDKELEYLTTLDGVNHYAIGIEEREKLKRGLAIIRLVRSSVDSTEGEVAITIIDEYQKMGIGTLLLKLIILAALERGIETLSFTFLPQNTALPKLLTKVGTPRLGHNEQDSIQMFLDIHSIDCDLIKKQLQSHLESIETFRLKT